MAGEPGYSRRVADSVAKLGPAEQDRLERLLVDGGERLRQNHVTEARELFTEALKIDPDNIKALGLLGLVCFRMNDFQSALPVYEHLVAIRSQDASFALNLGLVYLRLGRAADAIVQLQRCRELDPSQTRAVSYLGLANARNGQYAEAYQAFLQAGEDDLAEEMAQYLTEEQRAEIKASVVQAPMSASTSESASISPGDLVEQVTDDDVVFSVQSTVELGDDEVEVLIEEDEPVSAAAPETSESPPDGAPDTAPVVETPPPREAPASDRAVAIPLPRPRRGKGPGAISQAVALAVPSSAAAARAARVAAGHEPPKPLFEFATAKLIRPDDGDSVFELSSGGVLIVRVAGRVYSRTEGVKVTGGELAYEVAARRVRGSSSDEEFSSDGRPLFVVSGEGHMLASPIGERFTAVTLDEDILYLREDLVFAFEEQLRWENGHVPGSNSTIRMVQFRGQGSVAFRSKNPLLSIKLASERVLHVDAQVLAGWIGRVIPRAVTPAAGGEKSTLFVECTGEGVLLVEDEVPTGASDGLFVGSKRNEETS